ncbi:MAG TPA: hypothetical protein ACFYD3_06555 [Candidatus Hypogeohydataceae bacterium YC41]
MNLDNLDKIHSLAVIAAIILAVELFVSPSKQLQPKWKTLHLVNIIVRAFVWISLVFSMTCVFWEFGAFIAWALIMVALPMCLGAETLLLVLAYAESPDARNEQLDKYFVSLA